MTYATIKFRGEDVEVKYTVEVDYSVGIDGVSGWEFVSLSAIELTAAEELEILDQLSDHYADARYDADDYDLDTP